MRAVAIAIALLAAGCSSNVYESWSEKTFQKAQVSACESIGKEGLCPDVVIHGCASFNHHPTYVCAVSIFTEHQTVERHVLVEVP